MQNADPGADVEQGVGGNPRLLKHPKEPASGTGWTIAAICGKITLGGGGPEVPIRSVAAATDIHLI